MLRSSPRALVLALMATGCTPVPTDLVSVALSDGTSVELDSSCIGDCIDEVTLQVTFEEHLAVDLDEQVEFLQYKVDYAIEGVTITSFADETSLTVGTASTGFVDFLPASWIQQDEVYEAVGGDPISGTATVTLAGYDWRNENLLVSTSFEVSFEDLAED